MKRGTNGGFGTKFELGATRAGLVWRLRQTKMAEQTGETLNSLFDVLADWNHQLKHAKVDFEGPRP